MFCSSLFKSFWDFVLPLEVDLQFQVKIERTHAILCRPSWGNQQASKSESSGFRSQRGDDGKYREGKALSLIFPLQSYRLFLVSLSWSVPSVSWIIGEKSNRALAIDCKIPNRHWHDMARTTEPNVRKITLLESIGFVISLSLLNKWKLKYIVTWSTWMQLTTSVMEHFLMVVCVRISIIVYLYYSTDKTCMIYVRNRICNNFHEN